MQHENTSQFFPTVPPSHRLRTADLHYQLPEQLIALTPAQPRESARLLTCSTDPTIAAEHLHIHNLPSLLRTGDLLILNNTRVLPARFVGVRLDTGGKVEGLYLSEGDQPRSWRVLLKMKRAKPGVVVGIHDQHGHIGALMKLLEKRDDSSFVRTDSPSELRSEAPKSFCWMTEVVSAEHQDPRLSVGDAQSTLNRLGLTPLPPYILAARKAAAIESIDSVDRQDYQTVFSGHSAGSVAAPTAGLHFTPKLLETLKSGGVNTAYVTLHVGLGTFKPVETEFVEDHPMHEEWCTVPHETVAAIEAARSRGGRVIAVGTTSVRTLESFDSLEKMREFGERGHRTNMLITPGYRFKFIDGLLTNFHLPGSTLMALVAAMLEYDKSGLSRDGVACLQRLYAEAIAQNYRFYSFGDAMLILQQ